MLSLENIEIKVKKGWIDRWKIFVVPAIVVFKIAIAYFVFPR